MNKADILALYTQDQRIEVEYPDSRRERLPNLVRHVNISGGEGAIIYSELDEHNVEQTIQEQLAYFNATGQDFEWKLYDYDQPPDLKERLVAHGFEIEEPEAIMVLDLRQAPAALFDGPIKHDLRRITTLEALQDVRQIEEQVWDTDETDLIEYLTGSLTDHPDQMSIYVAYIDNVPASSGWIYFPKQSRFASLWGGSTVQQYRKQGLYRALLATRAQEARERGVEYLTVDASPMSRPILEKLGFEVIAYAWACKAKAKP
jgi:GNAT superfamily N-acetyltransferase